MFRNKTGRKQNNKQNLYEPNDFYIWTVQSDEAEINFLTNSV